MITRPDIGGVDIGGGTGMAGAKPLTDRQARQSLLRLRITAFGCCDCMVNTGSGYRSTREADPTYRGWDRDKVTVLPPV